MRLCDEDDSTEPGVFLSTKQAFGASLINSVISEVMWVYHFAKLVALDLLHTGGLKPNNMITAYLNLLTQTHMTADVSAELNCDRYVVRSGM